MSRILVTVVCLLAMSASVLGIISTPAHGAILIESPNGVLVPGPTNMAAACNQSYTVHITSALSAAQSNYSSATMHYCTAPINIHPGGSVGNTTTFRVTNVFTAGNYQVFNGGGVVTFTKDSTPDLLPAWWGAVSGAANVAQTTQALQAALDAAGASGINVHIPACDYYINTTLLFRQSWAKTFDLVGESSEQSNIWWDNVGAGTTPMVQLGGNWAGVYENYSIRHLKLNGTGGGGYASDGVYGTMVTKAKIEDVKITASLNGIRILYGYSNRITKTWAFGLTGSGILLGQGSSGHTGLMNNTTIDQCTLYNNSGIGIVVGGGSGGTGSGNSITNCDIELNALAGVVVYNQSSPVIRGNYFERNAATGYAYTSPENITVYADIHLLGSDDQTISTTGILYAPEIAENTFQPIYTSGSIIFTNYLQDASIYGNTIYNIGSGIPSMLGAYQTAAYSTYSRFNLSKNTNNTIALFGTLTNNAVVSPDDFTGTFTATLTGCTTSPTASATYTVSKRVVALTISAVVGTSNTTAATITGLPATLIPVNTQLLMARIENAGEFAPATVQIDSSGVITLYSNTSGSAFTNSGIKGLQTCTLFYSLD